MNPSSSFRGLSPASFLPTWSHVARFCGRPDPRPDEAHCGGLLIQLLACISEEATGTLTLTTHLGETWNLVVENGVIHSFESEERPPVPFVVPFLLERGWINSLHAEELKASSQSLLSVLKPLLMDGVCEPRDLVKAIRYGYSAQLLHVLGVESGTYSWDSETGSLGKRVVPAPLLDTLIETLLSAFANGGILSVSETAGRVRLRQLSFSGASSRVSEWFGKTGLDPRGPGPGANGPPTLEDWLKTLRPEEHPKALVYALLGGVLPGEERVPEVRLSEKERTCLNSCTVEDFFERLSLHWTCHPADLMDQYRARMTEIDYTLSGEAASQARSAINEAMKTLLDASQRSAYRDQRYGARLIQQRGQSLVDQARRHLKAGDPAAALRLLEAVKDLGIRTHEVLELGNAVQRALHQT